ncbi:19850_t:CDS:2 [Cetraspora pellucida]|uniref:19850_t:CDS:1 n=1 Tax=Cetraspora pellucida TaxID=1433469 RepID=A0A9N9NGP2_9GLOM|nr:19850_t:CDS:2 [Cetraspora pellucida]
MEILEDLVHFFKSLNINVTLTPHEIKYNKEKAEYDEEMEYNKEIIEDTQFEIRILSKIVIRKPSKDVYDEYTLFKCALKKCNNIDENLDIQFAKYIFDYHSMREAYENDIRMTKECDQSHFVFFLLTSLKMLRCLMTLNNQEDAKALKEANKITSMVYSFLTSVLDKADEIRWITVMSRIKNCVYYGTSYGLIIFKYFKRSNITFRSKGILEIPLTENLVILKKNEFKLLKLNINAESLNPQELLPKGLFEEKQVDIWNNIRYIAYCFL